MSVFPTQVAHAAGQGSWTRDLARDLFPAAVTPFHWTLLRRPIQVAMERTWIGLGAALPAADFWRRDANGHVYLNAGLIAQAGRAQRAAAWIGAPPEEGSGGFLSRWQAQGITRCAREHVDAVAAGTQSQNRHLGDWQAWVRRLRWTQADLLQVMEELEPHIEAILRAFFTVRSGLSAAQVEVAARLAEWLPDCPTATILQLYAGSEGLPSIEAAYAVAGLRSAPDPSDALKAFSAHYGHRGPGEAQPDAVRWQDHGDLVLQLAEQFVLRDTKMARALCRAVDLAWDGMVRAMAVAQIWAQTTAAEALAAGLIAVRPDVQFLEFEELKQIATGEWHRGRSEQVREAVMRRHAEWAAYPGQQPQPPRAASPGAASGPLLRVETVAGGVPPAGAVLLAEVADPGCAPYWLSAAAVLDGAGDPWAPGMIVARALGVPAVSGIPSAIEQSLDGDIVTVNGSTGQVALTR